MLFPFKEQLPVLTKGMFCCFFFVVFFVCFFCVFFFFFYYYFYFHMYLSIIRLYGIVHILKNVHLLSGELLFSLRGFLVR